jgi:DNA polymerase-3 subunit delta
MAASSAAAVRAQIASGAVDPLYLIVGEDELEKAALAADFLELVDEGLRAFNVERIHAAEMTTGDRLADGVSSIVQAVRTLPMMAPRRVVTVLQAETILAPRRESEAAARAMEELERLFAAPDPQTTLVLVAGAVDKRGRLYKVLAKHATIVECGAIENQADAERWLRQRAAAAGVELEPAAARLLAERAGPDLARLRADLERLLLYALGQKTMTLADAREVAGPATLQDDWAMTNAIEAGDAPAALRQLALMMDAAVPPEKILGQLGWLVRSKFPMLAPADLKPAVDALFRTDLALKGSGGDARVLLERLIVELCGSKRARAAGPRRW